LSQPVEVRSLGLVLPPRALLRLLGLLVLLLLDLFLSILFFRLSTRSLFFPSRNILT
jgi:hypothetical protein